MTMSITEWAFYVASLPRLDALESMRNAEAGALPWRAPPDRKRTWNHWQHLAFGDAADRDQSSTLPPDGMVVRRQASAGVTVPTKR